MGRKSPLMYNMCSGMQANLIDDSMREDGT